MNKTIKLAVAGAVLSAATVANAGIIIPAGEWTIDINGNVNAYASWYDADDVVANAVTGGLAGTMDANGNDTSASIGTGLLPSWLGVTGTTRQNDLDVSFTISIQPGASDNSYTGDGATKGIAVSGSDIVVTGANSSVLSRQAFLTFGDASWGSVKLGKDLGIFASDAILNDMTLLGVGSGGAVSGSALNSTNGGIGTGYIYAAWKGQVAYTTPNMNGFQATVGITNPSQGIDNSTFQDGFGIEAKAHYAFPAGKVWVSGASYERDEATAANSYDVTVLDIGATVNVGNLALTGYYYSGEGAGTTFLGLYGANAGQERDSDGGYLQATYVIPSGTKLGASYGVSNLDLASGESASALVEENKRWTVGAYHPLTKHLNVVAEFTDLTSESHNNLTNDSTKVSLGAILFF